MTDTEDIVKKWANSGMLYGFSPQQAKHCAICMENQRLRNATETPLLPRFCRFCRISIPLVRRVYSFFHIYNSIEELSSIELLSRLDAASISWNKLLVDKYADGFGATNQLELDCEYVSQLYCNIGKKLLDIAFERGANKIYFGGIHLEGDILYALID